MTFNDIININMDYNDYDYETNGILWYAAYAGIV